MSKLDEIRARANNPFRTHAQGIAQLDEDRDYLLAEVDRLQSKMDGENKHWDAWDVYSNSGNLAPHHCKVFHDYIDGNVSQEYMRYSLGGGPEPCEHDMDFDFGDPNRPACEHCDRQGLGDS